MKKYLTLFLIILGCAPQMGNYSVTGECGNGDIEGAFTVTSIETKKTVAIGRIMNGLLDGPIVTFSGTGDTLTIISYRNGIMDGPVRLFYSPHSLRPLSYSKVGSGNRLKLTTTFSNGKLNGTKKHYYPSGQQSAEYVYKTDELVSAKGWYKDGEPAEQDIANMSATDMYNLDSDYYKDMEKLVLRSIQKHRRKCK
jgi:antitoxin component YwqK of YwqJK toxin-antitoxin module